MEHEAPIIEAKSGLHYNKLHAPVRSYVDNLRAQVYEVLGKYDVTNMTEFMAKMKKVAVPDREKVINLMKAVETAYMKNETSEYREKIEAIREQEAEALEKFFEKEINVPPIPTEITPERLKVWESQGLKLHYLPDEDMKENTHLKNWKKQPDYEKYLEFSKLPPDAMILKNGWVLVDNRKKPEIKKNFDQMYQEDNQGRVLDDLLGPVLESLRRNKIIKKFKHPQSRFNLSPEELEKPEVIAAFAEAYGVKPEQMTIQREIEFNVIGNLHHPEWGEPPSNCSEWFSDRYNAGRRRSGGGNSDVGGLSYVGLSSPDHRSGRVGFRVLVRFSP